MITELNPWVSLRAALSGNPKRHAFAEPCSVESRETLADTLGQLPVPIAQMLSVFDGAELSIDAIATFTLLGSAKLSGFDVTIETYTRRWRTVSKDENEWVIGFTNYGGYFIVRADGSIKEWDTAQSKWLGEPMSASRLVKRLVAESMEDHT